MRKIDKLVLKAFIGPFLLTFLVVIFILLNRQMLFYYDDIIGKDLGWDVLGEFVGYFAVFMLPQALPLSILLSSLICFGTLGEHFELTAIKAAGISLPRIMLPVFVVVIFLTGFAFFANNYIVPKAALNAWSLLYDIKQKKPAMDIREGVFYNGLPDISIKADKKFPNDPAAMGNIILYDHKDDDWNRDVYVADSARMFTILNDRYLKFEMFDGYNYREKWKSKTKDPLSRAKFARSELVIDLASFKLSSTDTRSFAGHRYMKNLHQLQTDIDSLQTFIDKKLIVHQSFPQHSMRLNNYQDESELTAHKAVLEQATNHARTVMADIANQNSIRDYNLKEQKGYRVQWHRIISYSFACVVMFLIGASLGSIIKKGGIGLPFLIAIVFFIIFYIFDMQGEKMANRDLIDVPVGMWMGNVMLSLAGLYFIYQARIDGRLFDQDFYRAIIIKVKRRFKMTSAL